MCTLQLERELQMICDIDGMSQEQNLEEYKPAIRQLAEEEATRSPRMKRLLTSHTSELETVDDGKGHKFILILTYESQPFSSKKSLLQIVKPTGNCCCSGDSKD